MSCVLIGSHWQVSKAEVPGRNEACRTPQVFSKTGHEEFGYSLIGSTPQDWHRVDRGWSAMTPTHQGIVAIVGDVSSQLLQPAKDFPMYQVLQLFASARLRTPTLA